MKVIRLIGVLVLVGVFSTLAVILYQKQKLHYSFRSFELPAPATAIFIPDFDRLIRRIEAPEDLVTIDQNAQLVEGLNAILKLEKTNFNADFGKTCFVSFTATDFNLVFKNQDLNANRILETVTNVFHANATLEEGRLQLAGKNYFISQFGAFTVVGTAPCVPNHLELADPTTNADYVILKSDSATQRYILAYNQVFVVWDEIGTELQGHPVRHDQFLKKVPLSFEELNFYGSDRFEQDKHSFFNEPKEEGYSWIDRGLLILKKGSYELMIAPQNDQRDLKLLLEEQTLGSLNDSVLLQSIIVKNFEILPFQSNFDWTNAIPALNQQLTHYTEFENFNILSNSLEAMQWYLSEIQIGNLVDQNELFMTHYQRSVPQLANMLHFVFDGNKLVSESTTWTEKMKQVKSSTVSSLNEEAEDNNADRSFDLPFEPSYLIPFANSGQGKILLANDMELALLQEDGTIAWQISLASKLIAAPELIDLTNDGISEIAIFSLNEFNVFGADGKLIPNLSIKTAQPIKGGMCVNYDETYDYRFFLVFATNVNCYNESGQPVSGWQFGGLMSPLTGSAYYTQINGVDFLTFKDVNSKVYLLNRKGENRFGTNSISKLPNESEFVIGKDEELVHKLGYANQNIYTRFLKDGYTDSLKLDIPVNAISARWIQSEVPMLVIEENNRILLFNSSGYQEGEVLKPTVAPTFIRVENTSALRYVFFNNANNSLYLLNKEGKIVCSGLSSNPLVYGINANYFYTSQGLKMYEQKIK